MDSVAHSPQFGVEAKLAPAYGPRLTGAARRVLLTAWGLVTLAGLLSLAVGIFSVNVWDRVPAAEAQFSRFFPGLTPADVQSHADYQAVVVQAGFSLAGYALIFTVARLIGGLALFAVGFLLIRRHSDRLMAVLMAGVLSVFGAAGVWGNPLWNWAVAVAPWLHYPVALLSWLLWCGLIVLYTFPDGKFVPRWTLGLAGLVGLISFFAAFDVHLFLNPDTWPDPWPLLPNIVFVGAGFLAVVYRYWRSTDPERQPAMRWYTLSLALLLTLYFVDFFINDIYYYLAGQPLIQGYRAGMVYALAYEPLWYALQVFFAVGLAAGVFGSKPKGLLDA